MDCLNSIAMILILRVGAAIRISMRRVQPGNGLHLFLGVELEAVELDNFVSDFAAQLVRVEIFHMDRCNLAMRQSHQMFTCKFDDHLRIRTIFLEHRPAPCLCPNSV